MVVAPGDYEIKDADYHRYEKDVKRPAFLSTAQRKFFEISNVDFPDPAHYDPPVRVKCTSLQGENRSSVFKSMVCRFGRYKDKVICDDLKLPRRICRGLTCYNTWGKTITQYK